MLQSGHLLEMTCQPGRAQASLWVVLCLTVQWWEPRQSQASGGGARGGGGALPLLYPTEGSLCDREETPETNKVRAGQLKGRKNSPESKKERKAQERPA